MGGSTVTKEDMTARRRWRWLALLAGLLPLGGQAAGPMANSAFNLQGGAGAWQLQEGEQVYRTDLESVRYQDVDGSSRSNLDLRVGFDQGITDRVQLGATVPFRTRLDRSASYGRHLRGDLRLLLDSDGQEATSLSLWGTVLEQGNRSVNSGNGEMGAMLNWSRREADSDLHFGLGTEQVDYPEERTRFESESRIFLQGGLVERMSDEHAFTLEFELGRTYNGDRRTMMFMPGMRWFQPGTDLIWTGRIGLAPDAVEGRASFSGRIGLSYLIGARADTPDRRVRELEERVDTHERRITDLEDWVSRQPTGEEPEEEEAPEMIRVVIQDTMGDEDRAESWGRRFEEWGDYQVERVEYYEVDDEPETSILYYGPDTADAAVDFGRRIPAGDQEVLRNEDIQERGVIWLRMGRDMERYPEAFDAL